MISVGLAGPVILGHCQNFNVVIFSDAINVVSFKLCMMILLTELYLFMPHSVILIIFQGLKSVNQF